MWLSCSTYQKSALCSSALILSILIGSAIATSSRFTINTSGLEVTKAAIANQAELEKALLIIELQQKQISEAKSRAISINERTNVGGLLIEDLTKVEDILPPTTIEKIEGTIEHSEAVLDAEIN